MPSEISQRQRQLQQQQQQLQADIESQRSSPELYEEGSELDNDKAVRMQEHTGNEAIQDLIDQLGVIDEHLAEFEEQDQELGEETAAEIDQAQQLKGGNDGPPDASDDDPWAQEFFFGGDDEPIQQRKKRKQKQRLTKIIMEDDEPQQDKKGNPILPAIEDLLPTPEQGVREGDAQYRAVEMSLINLPALVGHSLVPEELQHREGVQDPIRLPIEMGKFLDQHALNEMASSLGTLVSTPFAPLLAPQGGFSTAVSRLATLAICAEITQGDAKSIDTAISLSLQREAWERCYEVAKELSYTGELHAPKIAERIIPKEALNQDQESLPPANRLGGAALLHILPAPIPFLPPSITYPSIQELDPDQLVNFLDQILFDFTTTETQKKLEAKKEPDPMIDISMLQPSLQTTNQILESLGRAQVEFATCAVAAHQIYPQTKMKRLLDHCDAMLKKIARSTYQAGKRIEHSQGMKRSEAEAQLEQAFDVLRSAHQSLESLRKWAVISFAGCAEEAYEA